MRQITDEVAAILRLGHGQDSVFYLPSEMLDRSLYVQVNKVLADLGGHWNRKLRCHVFPADPMPLIEQALAGGAYMDRRSELQLFDTPVVLAERMVKAARVEAHDRVLEPSAGRGQIVRELLTKTSMVTAIDIDEHNIQALRSLQGRIGPNMEVIQADFLAWGTVASESRFEVVVMNPPFTRGQDIHHVMLAFHQVRVGGRLVAIMSEGPFFRGDRQSIAFRDWLETLRGTSECLPDATFRESGTSVATRLVIIDNPRGS